MLRYTCSILSVVFLFGIISCDNESSPSADFDRGPMLENLGSKIILPAYDTLVRRSERLQTAVQLFNTTPDSEHLLTLRERWLETYVAYQHCAFFNFGPADEHLLNTSLNTFPTNKNKVNDNIESGSYNLQLVSNNDAKGLSALDFLLFGLASTDEELLIRYTSDPQANARKQYLIDVVNDLLEKTMLVFEAWSPSGGDYLSTFISRTGNDVGSSTGMLLNAAIQFLERDLRDAKIGIPLGVRSLNVPIPNNCEALHAEQSILLAEESAKALQNLYWGKSQTDGLGFDDYLAAINAKYNGGLLNDAIQSQLQLTVSKVSAIPEPYAETVSNNPGVATEAYQELQKLTILLKTDMTSALGILITYQDNDGD